MVQQALRNHYVDSVGLPRLHVAAKLNPVEPPWYVTRMPGGVGGRRREASPIPIIGAFRTLARANKSIDVGG